MTNIDATLAERGSRYGEFPQHAEVTQAIKHAMSYGRNWGDLPPDMKEALEMVAHKVGRILNGDPDYIDSWTDIIGYTRLVEKRLIDAEQTAAKALMAGNLGTPLGTTSERNLSPQAAASMRARVQADAAAPKFVPEIYNQVAIGAALAEAKRKVAEGAKPAAAEQPCDCAFCKAQRRGEPVGIDALIAAIFAPAA